MTLTKQMNFKTFLTAFLCLFVFATAVQTVEAAKPKTEAQQLKHDKKYMGFAQKQLRNVSKYLSMDSLKSAERSIKNAEKYIGKISDGFMKEKEGIALSNEYNDLKKQVEGRVSGAAAASETANAILQEKINFSTSVRKYATVYYLLNSGKNTSNEGHAYDFSNVEMLRDNLAEFVAYEAEFRNDFPNLIKGNPDYAYEGITPANLLDLTAHAAEYQANFTEVVGNLMVDNKAHMIDGEISGFNEYKRLSSSLIDDLYGSKTSNKYFDLDSKLKPYYDAVSRQLPADRMQKLAAYKPKLREMLETAAKTNEWDDKKYPMQNGDMDKVAEHFAERKGWEFIKCGSTDTAYLKKNALGVPLHKYYEGMMVVHVGDEPFNRSYLVTFYDYFDGTGYPGISDMKVSLDARPYKR